MKKFEAKFKQDRQNTKKSAKNSFNPSEIEPKWQSKWEKERIYHPDLDSANGSTSSPLGQFYNLMMFPYPSAEGLHIGGTRTFAGVDIYGRYKRMRGYSVFQPFGLDGFGIHAENYALKIGENPMTHAKITEENFYRQIRESAIGVDWGRTVETYKVDYYQWTQWIFVELFKNGLAYRKKSPVNFCPSCKTVLADEQVIDGKCERCGSVVEKRDLEQWFFKITKYADRLLRNIEGLDWTEKVKIAQRNWIGKKEGIEISYQIAGLDRKVTVFTTRPDTNFGATFIALAPESSLVNYIVEHADPKKQAEIKRYINEVKNKTEIERQAEGREKTGVFTGLYAINQLTGYKMPIWVSDFVLMGFGTGAVVGVPGHDKRDFEFAYKFGLKVIRVVVGKDDDESPIAKIDQVQEEEGTMINSDFLNGLDIHKATEKIMDYLEEKGWGQRKTTYHLRDWLISRQRYWGPPIPVIYCEACAKEGKGEQKEMPGWFAVMEKDLPVELPFIEDFKPLGTGKSPLGNHPEFYEVKCPNCGKMAKRETDVSDTFLDSSWYFFRYISTEFDDKPFDKERAKKWLPVAMYIGGAEHSVLHLLYARFITMFFKDLGLIHFEEPFARFYAHGLIIKDGAKMSKSKGNVVGPDEYIKKYGADTLRMYLHFLAPFNQEGDFRDEGIEGMNRFLKRVWAMLTGKNITGTAPSPAARGVMHQAIKGVTEDMEELRFNTAIAQLMTWYNFLSKQESISKEEAQVYLKLLAPLAPHMTEEIYQNTIKQQKNTSKFESIHTESWPEFDEKYVVADTVKIPVQVNGTLRGIVEVSSADAENKEMIEKLAKSDGKVNAFLKEKKVKKFIFIPGKIANFVI